MTGTQQLGGGNGRAPGEVPSIPLSPDHPTLPSDQSIGNLVRDATTHLSVLVRSEVELARTEVLAEVRKGLRGSAYFIIALATFIFFLFFVFFTVAEILAIWLPRSAAFGIVTGLGLLLAALFALLGYLRMRSIRPPQRTIDSVRESAAALGLAQDEAETGDRAELGPPR